MSTNQLGLTFDEKSFYNDLISMLMFAVHDAAMEVLLRMKQEATEVISDDSAWFIAQDLLHIGKDMIIFNVGAQHWLAFLDNYGTGSLMDTNGNPFLDDYLKSEYFNKDRLGQGMAVLGRGHGVDYASPNYKDGHGEVKKKGQSAAGVNLEEKINPRTGKPYYIPHEAKHWLEHAILFAQTSLTNHVNKTIRDFNFTNPKYLKGGIR